MIHGGCSHRKSALRTRNYMRRNRGSWADSSQLFMHGQKEEPQVIQTPQHRPLGSSCNGAQVEAYSAGANSPADEAEIAMERELVVMETL